MSDEGEGITLADTMFYIDGTKHTVYEYLTGVDLVLAEIKQSGEWDKAMGTLRSMSALGHAIGISKAKLLHGLWNLWDMDGDFYAYVASFGHMPNKTVVDRYIHAWDALQYVPEGLRGDFIMRPMKDLNALGAAIQQGYMPKDEDWEELSQASNNAEFLKIIREDVKGKDAKKNGLVLFLEASGDIVGWSDNKPVHVGYLDVGDTDPVVVKAIERIVNSCGIIKR